MAETRVAADAGAPWEGLVGNDRYAACLLAARAGDRHGLDVLVAELTPLLWHVVRSTRLDGSTSEDVVQTVWLALLNHLHRLNEPRALVAWLITTARREAYRCQHRNGRERAVCEFDDMQNFVVSSDRAAHDAALPEPMALCDDRDRRLWTAFTRLPAHCQELLRLTVLVEKVAYKAVAEMLRRPVGSIGPTRGRCLATLRQLLEVEGDMR